SALILGQARGVVLVTPARRGLPVAEYAANLVKKSVVGAGHAEKTQVQVMVKTLLPTARFKGADAADALAIAICHAHHRVSARRMGMLTGLASSRAWSTATGMTMCSSTAGAFATRCIARPARCRRCRAWARRRWCS